MDGAQEPAQIDAGSTGRMIVVVSRMNKFLYLLQGTAADIDRYDAMLPAEHVDAIKLTYDRQRAGCLYAPRTTWTTGRNLLLRKAKRQGDGYLYFVFLDDDLEFSRGDFRDFENALLRLRPAIASPQYDNWMVEDEKRWLETPAYVASPLALDPCFMAFHRDVVADGFIVPYCAEFDVYNWWYSARIAHFLAEVFYPMACLRIGTTRVRNLSSRPYPKSNRLPRHVLDGAPFLERMAYHLSPDVDAKLTPLGFMCRVLRLAGWIDRSSMERSFRMLGTYIAKRCLSTATAMDLLKRAQLKRCSSMEHYDPKPSYRMEPSRVRERVNDATFRRWREKGDLF